MNKIVKSNTILISSMIPLRSVELKTVWLGWNIFSESAMSMEVRRSYDQDFYHNT